jgi:DNA-directed RNA polymerase subunit M/transcription elongation factor TFIIS
MSSNNHFKEPEETQPKKLKVIELPLAKEGEKGDQEPAKPVLKTVIKACPECGETEEWYYDQGKEIYLCGKCRKIFYE